MNFDKLVTTLTMAGLVGAVLINWTGANELFKTLGKVGNDYVSTVQARPAR